MKSFGSRLKLLRNEKKVSQEELSKILGVSKSSISMYENNNREPGFEIMEAIADFFNVDMNFLYCKTDARNSTPRIDNIFPVPTTRIPLLGTIAAGEPVLAEENIEEYIDLKEYVNADFCLRIKGNSMIGAGIKDGDIIFIHQQPTVEDGEIAAVLIEDSATLKRVFKVGDIIQLRSENPAVEPITLNGDRDAKILGKAVGRLTKIY